MGEQIHRMLVALMTEFHAANKREPDEMHLTEWAWRYLCCYAHEIDGWTAYPDNPKYRGMRVVIVKNDFKVI